MFAVAYAGQGKPWAGNLPATGSGDDGVICRWFATPTPTASATPTPTAVPSGTPTATASATATASGTPTTTASATATASGTPTVAPTGTPSPTSIPPTVTATVGPTATFAPTIAPTASPTPASLVVTLLKGGTPSGSPGQSVTLGTVSYFTSGTHTISSIAVAVGNPGLFSSLTLTPTVNNTVGTSVTVSSPNIAASTVFTFNPPLAVPVLSTVNFDLSGVLAGGLAAKEPSVRAAGMLVVGGQSDHLARLLALLLGLSVLGMLPAYLLAPSKRRVAMVAGLMVLLGVAVAGCGSSSSKSSTPPPPSSTQSITQIQATNSGSNVDFRGLPVVLGTITLL